jgi:hypothetical protein
MDEKFDFIAEFGDAAELAKELSMTYHYRRNGEIDFAALKTEIALLKKCRKKIQLARVEKPKP